MMKKTLFLYLLLVIEVISSFLAWPNPWLPTPSFLSAFFLIVSLVPLMSFLYFLKGRHTTGYTGLAWMAFYGPAAFFLTGLRDSPVAAWLGFGGCMAAAFLTGYLIAFLQNGIQRRFPWAFLLTAPALFVAQEFLRVEMSFVSGLMPPPTVMAAFPLAGWPRVIQMASLTGATGVTFLAVFLAGAVVAGLGWLALRLPQGLKKMLALSPEVIPAQTKVFWTVGVVLTLGLAGLVLVGNSEAQRVQRMMQKPEHTLKTALLQTNADPWDYGKLDRSIQSSTVHYYRRFLLQAAHQGAELAVFSEGAMPARLPADQWFWSYFRESLQESGLSSLSGITSRLGTQWYNVWYLADPKGRVRDYYVKQYLVAYGEYFPLRRYLTPIIQVLNTVFQQTYSLFRMTAINRENWDMTAGQENRVLSMGERKFGIKICDELLYAKLFRKDIAQGAEAIISPAAGDWFSKPYYLRTKLLIMTFRAVEVRRWIAYVSNMNAAAYVDALGKIRSLSTFGKSAVLVQSLPLLTIRTLYSQWGDWFSWLCVVVVAGFILMSWGAFFRKSGAV